MLELVVDGLVASGLAETELGATRFGGKNDAYVTPPTVLARASSSLRPSRARDTLRRARGSLFVVPRRPKPPPHRTARAATSK